MAETCCCFVDYTIPVLGLLLIWYGMSRHRTAQHILNTPTSKVRSAAVGLVELKGRVILNKKLVSPISGRECAYYEIMFMHHGGPLFNLHSKQVSSLYLDDGTGKVPIKLEGANMAIRKYQTYRGSLKGKDALDGRILKFIKGLDISKRQLLEDGNDIWIRERIIAEGDQLYVMGTASPMENAPRDAPAHERLVIHKGFLDRIMVVSDKEETDVFKEIKGWASVYMGLGTALVLGWLIFVMVLPLFWSWAGSYS